MSLVRTRFYVDLMHDVKLIHKYLSAVYNHFGRSMVRKSFERLKPENLSKELRPFNIVDWRYSIVKTLYEITKTVSFEVSITKKNITCNTKRR